MHQIRLRLVLRPMQTPLRELTALPRPLAWFKWTTSIREGNVLFLLVACCNMLCQFSLTQTAGQHRYHDSPLPETSSWMENCTKFGQLIFSKISKIVATSCQILRLKCTKFERLAPDPTGGAHSAPADPVVGYKGLTSKGMETDREGERERDGREGTTSGKGRGEGERREREDRRG